MSAARFNPHAWQLAPIAAPDTIYIVAVCTRCGVSRSTVAGRKVDKRINLAGDCRPDEPMDDSNTDAAFMG